MPHSAERRYFIFQWVAAETQGGASESLKGVSHHWFVNRGRSAQFKLTSATNSLPEGWLVTSPWTIFSRKTICVLKRSRLFPGFKVWYWMLRKRKEFKKKTLKTKLCTIIASFGCTKSLFTRFNAHLCSRTTLNEKTGQMKCIQHESWRHRFHRTNAYSLTYCHHK